MVFNLTKPGNVLRAILGDAEIGTSIGCSAEPRAAAAAAAAGPAAAAAGDASESEADAWEQHHC